MYEYVSANPTLKKLYRRPRHARQAMLNVDGRMRITSAYNESKSD